MKYKLSIFLFILHTFILCSCSANHFEANSTIIDIEASSIIEASPITESTLLEVTDVDLDGEGLLNDTFLLTRIVENSSIYELLTVYLSSGLTDSIKIPCMNANTEPLINYAIGPIYYENKNSIVLEFSDLTSNYGAAEFHIYNIELYQGEPSTTAFIQEVFTYIDDSDTQRAQFYENTLYHLPTTTTTTLSNDLLSYRNDIERYALRIEEYTSDDTPIDIYYVYRDGKEWKHVTDLLRNN